MIYTDSYSDCGGRNENEDSIRVLEKDNIYFCLVADGLGGHGGGTIASREVSDVLVEELGKNTSETVTNEQINNWIQIANKKIYSLQTKDCKMKTTIAAVYVLKKEKRAYVVHVGDSRIYHFVNGKITFYSFDHSVARMDVLNGRIGLEDLRNHPDRSKLLRCVGVKDTVRVEFDEINYSPKDENIFLVCSDGFWEYVIEEKMENFLSQSKDLCDWMEIMKNYLMSVANKDNDNNSAIAFQIVEE